jgi:hypothetical protein
VVPEDTYLEKDANAEEDLCGLDPVKVLLQGSILINQVYLIVPNPKML